MLLEHYKSINGWITLKIYMYLYCIIFTSYMGDTGILTKVKSDIHISSKSLRDLEELL